MRRKEFDVMVQYGQDVVDFMNVMTYGSLALVSQDDYPRIIPLNYVYYNNNLYFHGSRIGEKIGLIEQKCKATFAITEEYAIIPSYLEDEYFACPATAFFKSVIVYGNIAVVEDEEEKHIALNELMKKLQPEGGYAPIEFANESYRKRVKTTAVIRLAIDNMSAKFKFGQNFKETKHENVKVHLTQRNKGLDRETVEMMDRYCPYHQRVMD